MIKGFPEHQSFSSRLGIRPLHFVQLERYIRIYFLYTAAARILCKEHKKIYFRWRHVPLMQMISCCQLLKIYIQKIPNFCSPNQACRVIVNMLKMFIQFSLLHLLLHLLVKVLKFTFSQFIPCRLSIYRLASNVCCTL